MTMITVVSKNGAKITVPIKNILVLEKSSDDHYYVYLPMQSIEVGRNQFNGIIQFMEENNE